MASLSISPQLAPPPFSSSSSSLSSSSSSSQSPSKTYTYQYDCSFGLCTFDCPQWCILPPPPPLFFTTDNDGATSSSSSHISPLMAALIAVLAASFCLLCYFTVFSKFFRNRRNNSTRNSTSSSPFIGSSSARLDPLVRGSGLDEAYIRQITVFKYNKEDKIVDSIECAVCLSEFNEGENLRLMPNCQHAFHIPCIDTWLLTHSNCPLCRSTMSPLPVAATATASAATTTTTTNGRSLGSNINYSNPSTLTNGNSNSNSVSVAAMRVERRSNEVVLVVREVDNRVQVVEPAQGVGLVRTENLDERESKLQVVNDNNVA